MEDCIFCKIVRGKLESEIIYETENAISFLDANPTAPGHSLVVPKKHVKALTDLDEVLVGEVFSAVIDVEGLLRSSLDPDAFTVGINDGEAAGQEIPHLHINVIPRFRNDGGKSIHAVVINPPKEEISETAKKIREASSEL